MAQDSAGRTIVPAGYNGNFEVVDMNFSDDTKVIQINQLNGRQGDTRTARIKAVQDNSAGTGTVAYSIDGLQPQIVGKDAKGNTIQIAGNWNPINVNLGLFSITAPANVYQAVGLTQGCYLRLVDNGGNVVSSIPVIFEVVQDSSSMTNYEATTFLQSVDSVTQQATEKFDAVTSIANNANTIAQTALTTAQSAETNATAQGNAKLSGDNQFTGHNTFSGTDILANQKIDENTFFLKTTVNGWEVWLARRGGAVEISIAATTVPTAYAGLYTTWAAAGAIPIGYRPSLGSTLVLAQSAYSYDSNANAELPFQNGAVGIGVDGSIQCRNFSIGGQSHIAANASNYWYNIFGSYVTNDSYPTA